MSIFWPVVCNYRFQWQFSSQAIATRNYLTLDKNILLCNVENRALTERHWAIRCSQGCATRCSRAARIWREKEEMKRKWRENEEMEREGGNEEEMERRRKGEEMERDSSSTFPHSLFISSLSIHFHIKICLILSQNVKYGTFVANVTKTLTYALLGNISGSNSLQGSSYVLSICIMLY